jgi:hypothetical protein
VCLDGSIFVDRDGEHFGHVLEYMRDGMVSVAEAGARPHVSLLRALKREFGYYCIELVAEQAVGPLQLEMAYIMGGNASVGRLPSMERYDAVPGQWNTAAAIGTARNAFGACVIGCEIYVTEGADTNHALLSSVEKYLPSSNTWSVVAQMPEARYCHAAVAVESAMFVLGGLPDNSGPLGDFLKFDSTQGT